MSNIQSPPAASTVKFLRGLKVWNLRAIVSIAKTATRGMMTDTEFKFALRREADLWAKSCDSLDRTRGKLLWDLVDEIDEDLHRGATLHSIKNVILFFDHNS